MYGVCATHNMLLQKNLPSFNYMYLTSLSKILEHVYGPFQLVTKGFFAMLSTLHVECVRHNASIMNSSLPVQVSM